MLSIKKSRKSQPELSVHSGTKLTPVACLPLVKREKNKNNSTMSLKTKSSLSKVILS